MRQVCHLDWTADMDLDRRIFQLLVAIILGVGLLMVHSASMTSRPTEFEAVYLSRHAVFVGLGMLVAVVASRVPAPIWQRVAPWLFWGSVALLVVVLIPGLGTRVNGAQRWFRWGAFSMQPAELVKITLPLYIASLAAARHDRLHTWSSGFLGVAFPAAIAVPLVMIQPDLGTSLFLGGAALTVLFVAGWPLRNFFLSWLPVVPALLFIVVLKPYQLRRISGFVTMWSDWEQAPYQLKQSLLALSGGGWLGLGLGQGQQKLSYLPEANTDFVFAVVGEELGLVGTLTVIALWLAVFLVGLRLVTRVAHDRFAFAAAFTLLTELVLQALLNIAVVTAMVPPKGIPHPLVSYGGSSMLVSLTLTGILLGLTRQPASHEAGEPPG